MKGEARTFKPEAYTFALFATRAGLGTPRTLLIPWALVCNAPIIAAASAGAAFANAVGAVFKDIVASELRCWLFPCIATLVIVCVVPTVDAHETLSLTEL